MMMGAVFFQKKMVRNIYNAKYQKTYYNRYYVLKSDYIKRYNNTSDVFRKKIKGNCFCVS